MTWVHTRTDRHMCADETFIFHVWHNAVVTPNAKRSLWRGEVMALDTGHMLMECQHTDLRYVQERCEEFAKAHRAEYERVPGTAR